MRVTVSHGIDDLHSDLAAIPAKAARDMVRVVRKNAVQGNRIAQRYARRSARAHGKHYPDAFTVEAITPLSWEYGPDSSKPQGGMSFEGGSRNQKPHRDLAKSQEAIGPKFAADVRELPGRWFW